MIAYARTAIDVVKVTGGHSTTLSPRCIYLDTQKAKYVAARELAGMNAYL